MRKKKARRLIAQGRTGKAIRLLLGQIGKFKKSRFFEEVRDNLICLSSQFNQSERDFEFGLINNEERMITFSKINQALIRLLRSID